MIGNRIKIEKKTDSRGMLTAINDIPFEAKRIFFISDVPKDAVRGGHFSKTSQFLYLVVEGACKVELDNGIEKENHELNMGDGLIFKKNTWMILSGFKEKTILCVLADTEYNPSDYSENYNELHEVVRGEDV